MNYESVKLSNVTVLSCVCVMRHVCVLSCVRVSVSVSVVRVGCVLFCGVYSHLTTHTGQRKTHP